MPWPVALAPPPLPPVVVKSADFSAHPTPTESETLEVTPSNLCFKTPSKWFWCTLKFENHRSTRWVPINYWILKKKRMGIFVSRLNGWKKRLLCSRDCHANAVLTVFVWETWVAGDGASSEGLEVASISANTCSHVKAGSQLPGPAGQLKGCSKSTKRKAKHATTHYLWSLLCAQHYARFYKDTWSWKNLKQR